MAWKEREPCKEGEVSSFNGMDDGRKEQVEEG
jgi:hypothetical protein